MAASRGGRGRAAPRAGRGQEASWKGCGPVGDAEFPVRAASPGVGWRKTAEALKRGAGG